MSHRQGFVLITALLVAVLGLILSFSSLYLAGVGRDVAANLRDATDASLAADGGVDQAFARLRRDWTTAPTLFSTSVGSNDTVTVVVTPLDTTTIATATRVRVESTGRAARGAEAVASALLERQTGEPPAPPPPPLIGLHAGNGLELNGVTRIGSGLPVVVMGSLQANALQNRQVTFEDASGGAITSPAATPVQLALGAACFNAPAAFCAGVRRAVLTVAPRPFDLFRNAALRSVGVNVASVEPGTPEPRHVLDRCPATALTPPAGATAWKKKDWETWLAANPSAQLCLAGDIPDVNLDGRVIFATTELRLDVRTLKNTTILTGAGANVLFNRALDGTDVRLLVDGRLTFNSGPQRLTGRGNVIGSRQTLIFDGHTGAGSSVDCASRAEIVSDDEVTYNSDAELCGSIEAGRKVMLNGTNRIAGGVRAGGSIVVNSRLELRLPDLTSEPARTGGAARAGVRVVSRR